MAPKVSITPTPDRSRSGSSGLSAGGRRAGIPGICIRSRTGTWGGSSGAAAGVGSPVSAFSSSTLARLPGRSRPNRRGRSASSAACLSFGGVAARLSGRPAEPDAWRRAGLWFSIFLASPVGSLPCRRRKPRRCLVESSFDSVWAVLPSCTTLVSSASSGDRGGVATGGARVWDPRPEIGFGIQFSGHPSTDGAHLRPCHLLIHPAPPHRHCAAGSRAAPEVDRCWQVEAMRLGPVLPWRQRGGRRHHTGSSSGQWYLGRCGRRRFFAGPDGCHRFSGGDGGSFTLGPAVTYAKHGKEHHHKLHQFDHRHVKSQHQTHDQPGDQDRQRTEVQQLAEQQ